MGFFSSILDELFMLLDGASFFGQVFIVLLFYLCAMAVGAVLYLALIFLGVAIYQWWCGTRRAIAVVPAAVEPPVLTANEPPMLAYEEVPQAGGEPVRGVVLLRRRGVRHSASGEPGSSSGGASERERE